MSFIVLVPFGIIAPTDCANLPISFASVVYQKKLAGVCIKYLYSCDIPLVFVNDRIIVMYTKGILLYRLLNGIYL